MIGSEVPEPVSDTGAWAGSIAAVLGVLGILWAWAGRHWWAERKAHRAFMRQFREDWTGTVDRPGVPGRPGVMQSLLDMRGDWTAVTGRLAKLEKDFIAIRQQMTILHNRMAACEQRVPLPDAEDEKG